MKILLLRHGKTRGNAEHRYVGCTDEPLLACARQELAASPYRQFAPELVYVSPLLRARETAKVLFPDTPLQVVEDFREKDFGRFEYRNHQELAGEPAYQAWIDSGGTLPFPEGEPLEAFCRRSREAFLSCLGKAEDKGIRRVAIVAHGGTIMAVMSAFARPKQEFYAYQVKNGEGYLLDSQDISCKM